MILTISDVFAVLAYRRVYSEEGAYDVQDGFNVIAVHTDSDGRAYRYLYTGLVGAAACATAYNFADEAEAMDFAGRVDLLGCIETSSGWFSI